MSKKRRRAHRKHEVDPLQALRHGTENLAPAVTELPTADEIAMARKLLSKLLRLPSGLMLDADSFKAIVDVAAERGDAEQGERVRGVHAKDKKLTKTSIHTKRTPKKFYAPGLKATEIKVDPEAVITLEPGTSFHLDDVAFRAIVFANHGPTPVSLSLNDGSLVGQVHAK